MNNAPDPDYDVQVHLQAWKYNEATKTNELNDRPFRLLIESAHGQRDFNISTQHLRRLLVVGEGALMEKECVDATIADALDYLPDLSDQWKRKPGPGNISWDYGDPKEIEDNWMGGFHADGIRDKMLQQICALESPEERRDAFNKFSLLDADYLRNSRYSFRALMSERVWMAEAEKMSHGELFSAVSEHLYHRDIGEKFPMSLELPKYVDVHLGKEHGVTQDLDKWTLERLMVSCNFQSDPYFKDTPAEGYLEDMLVGLREDFAGDDRKLNPTLVAAGQALDQAAASVSPSPPPLPSSIPPSRGR